MKTYKHSRAQAPKAVVAMHTMRQGARLGNKLNPTDDIKIKPIKNFLKYPHEAIAE